jgi:hypothetical protein
VWRKLGLTFLLLVSCAASRHGDLSTPALDEALPSSRATFHGRAVIVTLDGARWQEIFDGTDPERTTGAQPHAHESAAEIMPNLDRLARTRGALVGAPGRGSIAASGPAYVSLPGYTEIMTGRPPTACQSNDCPRTTLPTLLDQAARAGARVAAFASWERLDRAVTSSPGRFYVSCGRHGDTRVDPYPGYGDFRPDALTADAALRYLAEEHPDVLFLGLGEPDEYAHRGDYEGYVSSLAHADAVLGRLFDELDAMGKAGADTSVLVTADHGRAKDFRNHGGGAPESARVWLFAAGPYVTARGRVPSDGERRLADLAPTLRLMLGLTADPSPSAGRPLAELFAEPASLVAVRR